MSVSRTRTTKGRIAALAAAAGIVTIIVVPLPAVADSGDRLGCNAYCQNAAPEGGGGGAGEPSAVTILAGPGTTVFPDADGYVPVALRCNLSWECNGALAVTLPKLHVMPPKLTMTVGKSNLLVSKGATRTIAVPLPTVVGEKNPASTIALLRTYGPQPLNISADASQSGRVGHYGPNGYVDVNGITGYSAAGITVAAPGG
jgi:hypothetical protein